MNTARLVYLGCRVTEPKKEIVLKRIEELDCSSSDYIRRLIDKDLAKAGMVPEVKIVSI